MENPDVPGKSNKKWWVLSFVILGILVVIHVATTRTQNENILSVSSEDLHQVRTVEEHRSTIQKIKSSVGGTTASLQMVSEHNDDGRFLLIQYNLDDVFSKSYLAHDTAEITGNVLSAVFADPSMTFSNIIFNGDFTDRFGNSKKEIVFNYSITRKTYEKINWNNFDPGTLCDLLQLERQLGNEDNCYKHPGI